MTSPHRRVAAVAAMLALLLAACGTPEEPEAVVDDTVSAGFEFRIDPTSRSVALVGGLAPQRELATDDELGLASYSYTFLPGDVLAIEASFVNNTTMLDFVQEFFFTASPATTGIASSTEPFVSDADLGGDGRLEPAETTSVLTFEVQHRGAPFSYFILANADVEEREIDITTPLGEEFELPVELPDPTAGELGADVMFLFDRSGSFGDDLNTFRSQADAIVSSLSGSLSDVRVGLSSFVDAPCGAFGYDSSGDFGYELNLPLTSDTDQLSAALSSIDIRLGGDNPESQLEAMQQAMTGEGRDAGGLASCRPAADIAPSTPGWMPGRLHFLIVSTDASFHDPTDSGYPYPTSTADVIATAQASNTTIFFMNSGSTDADASTIAAATGGQVFNLSGSSGGIATAIDDAASDIVATADVRVVAEGVPAGLDVTVDPASFMDVDLTTTDEVTFSVSTSGPGLAPGGYEFDLSVRIDGVEVDRLTVLVTVP